MNDSAEPGADEDLWRLSLAQFREALANRATPGCGAAAAVAADFGLALLVKALRISEEREQRGERGELLRKAQALLGRPGAFADDDVDAFNDYLQASRDTPERLEQASRQACAVPLATARSCIEALGIAERAGPQVAPMLRSDVQAGGLLIHAALSAALLSVDADLPMIEDPSERVQAGRARQGLQTRADVLLRQLIDRPQS